MAFTVRMSPATGGIAEWLYWRNQNIAPSPGELLRRMDVLIDEAVRQHADIAQGKLVTLDYVKELAKAAQYCLADIGDNVRMELAEIASLAFRPPEGLSKFQIFVDGAYAPPDDPEYQRLQAEFDAKATEESERLERALRRAREKMLNGAAPGQAQPASSPTISQLRSQLVQPFAAPEGSTWDDIHIRFTSDFQCQIAARGHAEVMNYVDMGFEDRRGKRDSKPDGNWEALRRFAESDGAIQSTKEASDWLKLEKHVQTINARLRTLFGFSGNGIVYDKQVRVYRTRFKITPPPDFDRTEHHR